MTKMSSNSEHSLISLRLQTPKNVIFMVFVVDWNDQIERRWIWFVLRPMTDLSESTGFLFVAIGMDE